MKLRLLLLGICVITSRGLAQDVPAWSWNAGGQYIRAFSHGGAGFTLGLTRRLTSHWHLGMPLSYSSVGMGSLSGRRQLLAAGGELIYRQSESRRPTPVIALGVALVHSNVPLYSFPINGPIPAPHRTRDGTSVGLTVRGGLELSLTRRLRATLNTGIMAHSLYEAGNSAIWTVGLGFSSR